MNQTEFYLYKLQYEIDSADLFLHLENKDNIVVIDTRSQSAYEVEHIPGAVNIPHKTMTIETTKTIDKNALVVTYCDGIGCNGSTRGALNMTRLGFKVKEMLGGLDWWKRDGYATEGEKATVGHEFECGC